MPKVLFDWDMHQLSLNLVGSSTVDCTDSKAGPHCLPVIALVNQNDLRPLQCQLAQRIRG